MMIVLLKFPLVDTLGGAEMHTLVLARYWQRRGHEVKLFTSDKKLLMLFEKNNLPGEYLFAGWEPTSKWSLLLWPVTYLIARNKFKKIITQIPEGSMFFMQSLTEKLIFSRLLDSKFEIRDSVVWLEHKIPGRWLRLNPLLPKYLKLANQVKLVTVSNFARQELIKLGVAEKNITVIYPGVSPSPSRLRAPPSPFQGAGNIVIGILSRLDPEKGTLDFLKLLLPQLPQHPNWKILIAGSGRDEYEIKKLAKNYQQIKLLGFVENPDDFFAQTSVLVYPTKVPESFGMSALEALAHGTPVVASNLGALPEIIEHEKNGFLVSAPEQWILYLERLQDLNLYERLSQNAFTSAQNFSEEKMFERFDNILV